ncbi:TPA: AraC family transcriptional regulator [Pseudomonas aeruginosa]|nr:helix-turn-helix domain-containing protein [Comamonas aquatica]HBO7091716.1 AraC family transcriptional regulator [Pseudomonas aeruginosa]MDE1554352.1 helix-turn-helix domain-containing protein [Comamonas aquatica]HBO7137119.1 AraC family transcriptional regulator [Pseudomonas aeruginosa]HBO7336342.1 AraC family transcriptional regulator [Pseudomonas aeruginosa]HBO7400734.1 AraC family transcriptional regulator [Pseudomonas aeruginosa]
MQDIASFHRWVYPVNRAERYLVLPDGCQDVLCIRHADGLVQIVSTGFDVRPRLVDLLPGTTITGYRLRPGAGVSAPAMQVIAADHDRIGEILDEQCEAWTNLDEAIVALSQSGETVGAVCRRMGISIRTMQRVFLGRRLPPPDYWRLLGRARRAAGLLSSGEPLAEIASICSFSDQAHMNRELVRWFGHTPAQLRRQSSILELLRQPALGNWTGEQISTR